MNNHEKINYLEYAAVDLSATKHFFIQVFGWQFTDFGPDYMAFNFQGLEGGFYRADLRSRQEEGGALTVFYSKDLADTQAKVSGHGAEINKPIFAFPGGRRFHFIEPSGNEFAVWSDK